MNQNFDPLLNLNPSTGTQFPVIINIIDLGGNSILKTSLSSNNIISL